MMHYQMDHWVQFKEKKTLGAVRLRYSAGIAMASFFCCLILGFFFTLNTMLPFMVASVICWVVLGSASKKANAVTVRKKFARYS